MPSLSHSVSPRRPLKQSAKPNRPARLQQQLQPECAHPVQPAKVAVTLTAVHRPQRLRLQEPRRPRSPLHHCCQRVQQTLQPGPRLGTLPQHPRCASRVQDLPLGCLRPYFCRWQRPLDKARPVREPIFETWNMCSFFRMLETGRRAIRRVRAAPRRLPTPRPAIRRPAVRRRPHSPQTLNHFLSPSSVHDTFIALFYIILRLFFLHISRDGT